MNNFLISTVTAINLFLAPVIPNAIPVNQEKAQVKTAKKEIIRTIKPSESLSSIAIEYYGEETYWTTIWNDNPWIENPYVVSTGWKLKLRTDKPKTPEVLSGDLTQKIKQANFIVKVSKYPQSVSLGNGPLNDAQVQFLGNCESGMTASRNSGNGYYGAFQFSSGTWNRMETSYARADLAPIETQIDALQRLAQRSNIFGQFPACSYRMRAAGLI